MSDGWAEQSGKLGMCGIVMLWGREYVGNEWSDDREICKKTTRTYRDQRWHLEGMRSRHSL